MYTEKYWACLVFPLSDILPCLSSFSIGNEESDVECLKKAGMSGVPADACAVAQKAAGYICKNNGGCGAVREFAEHIFLLLEKVNSARKQMEEMSSAGKEMEGNENSRRGNKELMKKV